MTVKPIALPDAAMKRRQFPEFPPRADMQNPIYLYRPSHLTSLAMHLGSPDTTLVLSEVPVSPTLGNRDIRIPDLIVARDCNPARVIEERGYAIDRQGKPPDFALEVASVSTGRVDYTDKRLDYERFGIGEYWRFDPTGGRYYDAALAGDRLVDGKYRPIEIERIGEGSYRGYSEALELYACWEEGELRWYDAESGGYLRTHEEEISRAEREAARAEHEAARAERESERAERANAELNRLRERLKELGGSK